MITFQLKRLSRGSEERGLTGARESMHDLHRSRSLRDPAQSSLLFGGQRVSRQHGFHGVVGDSLRNILPTGNRLGNEVAFQVQGRLVGELHFPGELAQRNQFAECRARAAQNAVHRHAERLGFLGEASNQFAFREEALPVEQLPDAARDVF